MELGQRLKEARLAAGLSQRQLCGDVITRNMLSQIENGAARPSMDTLRYLAGRLEKPVSWFLDEQAVSSPNQAVMEEARLGHLMKEPSRVLRALEGYRKPDTLYDWEQELLELHACLELAEEALDRDYRPRAAELLDRAASIVPTYCSRELERRRLLLQARLDPSAAVQLPGLDEELLLRAQCALKAGNAVRCAALLEAAEDRESPRWSFLRGESYLAAGDYRAAADCYHKAEAIYPKQTASRLERCYRELEDYKRAYEYACKQR